MPGLHFDITGNNSNFLRKLDETQRGISQTSKKIESEGTSIENYFNKLAKGAATLGLGFSAAQLVKDIAEVRGQFQQLEIAFETMLKSKEKASTLMAQLTETAAKTPFDLQSVSQGAKQLLAYGTASEEVNDTLVRLGNIASGLSIPLGDLVYLYGTTQTQGRLFTQDVRQFMGRGIPLVKELAAELGKTEQQINEMVTAGKIGFPEVEKVIRNMTSENGQFYNLMEKQSQSLTGQISNLGDAWDGMLNKIGTQTQGIASSGISAVTSLIENYETAGKVLAGLVVTYGTYKAAIILLDVWKARDIALDYAKLMITGKLTVAQSLLNKTMLANPYVLLATAVVGAVAAMWAFHDSTTAAERISKSATDTMDRMAESSQKLKGKIDGLLKTIRDEASTQYDKTKAYKQLQEVMPTVFSNMDIETLKLMNHLSLNKQINEELNRREIIGAKTSVVLAQKRYDKAAAKYQKDIDNGLVGAGSLSEKSTAFVELETAKKVLSEIEKIQSEARKKKEEDSKKEPTHNKEYWEHLKKETQSQLDALTDIEAAGKKGAALKQKIAGYEQKIGSFSTSTSKQDNQSATLLQQQEKYNLLLDKQKLEQIRAEEDRWNQVWQAQIDAMDEGSEKTLSQMELNHERELQAIDREKEDLLRKKYDEAKALFDADEAIKAQKTSGYKPQSFDGSGIVLSPTESTQFDSKYKSTLDKQAKERQAYYASEKQAMNEYLAEYGAYMQKRQAIVDLYNERIAKATSKGEKLSLGEEMKKSLASVDDEVQKKTSIITKLFSDMNKRTVADMRAIADEAQAMLDYVNGGEFKTDDSGKGLFGLTKEQFDILSKSPEKLESIKNEIANVKTEADNAETSFDKMANGLDKVFSAGRDTKKLKEGLAEIESGMNDVMQVAGFLSNTLSSLGDAFGNDTLTGIADGINVAMGALGAGMEGAKAGAMFGPIGAAAGAAIGVVSSLASSIAKIHDAKNEKRIQRLQDQIEVLEKSYDKLGASIEKAYSKDASKLIEQNNQMLEQQKVLIQNQIREEQDKKKTDDGRIKEWQNQIEEINKLIEDNKEKAIDAIFGEDLKSAIDNFAQAYANAWTSGEDKAKSAKDTVRDMMRQMVTESIKAAIQSSGKMEEIRNKLKQFYADNVLSGWEQDYIYNMADNLQKELDNKFAWANDLMQDDESTSREASRGVFETMSQDTGNELNGRFTALQISNEEIKNQMITLNQVTASLLGINQAGFNELVNLRIQANSYLEDIAGFQKNMLGLLKDIGSRLMRGVKMI